jgi:hypothetical protein
MIQNDLNVFALQEGDFLREWQNLLVLDYLLEVGQKVVEV